MIQITSNLEEKLIKDQFPQWSHLSIKPVEKSGHDNRTFHLGDEMSVRLPSGEDYVPQVEKELFWLPRLKPHISFYISVPLAKGEPIEEYPFPWSVNQWIEGNTVSYDNILNLNQFAIDLASFLKELQAIDASNGPIAGEHNFYRGGDLAVYHEETLSALNAIGGAMETEKLHDIWAKAMESKWTKKNLWVHGDIAPGNLLVKNGELYGVIDFGILGVGDPSCDFAMAWTFFDNESRKTFLKELDCDEGTWNRARGWALWKALITYVGNEKDSAIAVDAKRVIDVILEDY